MTSQPFPSLRRRSALKPTGRNSPPEILRTYQAWSRLQRRHSSRSLRPRKGSLVVDPRWTRCFDTFLDDVGPCPDGYRPQRLDASLPYGPGNFVWAPSTGARRGRQAKLYVFNGEIRTLRDWAAHAGISEVTLRSRLSRHVPFERAIASVDYRKKA